MSIFEKENFIVLNKKAFHFENKMVFGYVKNFLFENKSYLEWEKMILGIMHCENILKRLIFFFQKGIVEN